MPAVRDVVAELAAKRTKGFRASYVAKKTGQPLADVQRDLVSMVDDGLLELQYQLLCPSNGSVLARYGADDELPIGEEINSDDCEPFVVEKRHLFVSYLPTADLMADLLAEARGSEADPEPGKAKAQRPRLRRWVDKAVAIDSMRTRTFSRGSISTST